MIELDHKTVGYQLQEHRTDVLVLATSINWQTGDKGTRAQGVMIIPMSAVRTLTIRGEVDDGSGSHSDDH